MIFGSKVTYETEKEKYVTEENPIYFKSSILFDYRTFGNDDEVVIHIFRQEFICTMHYETKDKNLCYAVLDDPINKKLVILYVGNRSENSKKIGRHMFGIDFVCRWMIENLNELYKIFTDLYNNDKRVSKIIKTVIDASKLPTEHMKDWQQEIATKYAIQLSQTHDILFTDTMTEEELLRVIPFQVIRSIRGDISYFHMY